MPRKNIYFKDKLDREIESILEIERQKGANASEANYSSTVNELVRLGLMVYKNKEEGPNFDLEGFRRDLISKVAGTREGIIILTTLITDMYLRSQGPQALEQLEEVVSQHIEAINAAEKATENQHFVSDEE
ncbi:conjugal transfer protein [Klebsiella aerogenes]|uniref:relaxosome protein TraM n=1 Tax=Enterobacteriaceae TaxID=543 RepID=UPI001330B47B|nr:MULTISPECIES: relaxosome protein TraM [Enterobacteriaceae]MBX9001904.1 conjugal transfer protein [Klebsiella aerogenes]MCM7653683.1 conjugal transfer protein [Enterobacter hormaechei]HCM9429408.1 conjugal transfer protein [Enterobacter hormaechei subsp. xiangfangensis]